MEEVIRQKVDNHEVRIIDLEKEKSRTEIKLVYIERDLAQLELSMKAEISKLDVKLDKFMGKVLDKQDVLFEYLIEKDKRDSDTNNDIKKTNNKNSWEVIKKFVPWVIAVLASASAYFKG